MQINISPMRAIGGVGEIFLLVKIIAIRYSDLRGHGIRFLEKERHLATIYSLKNGYVCHSVNILCTVSIRPIIKVVHSVDFSTIITMCTNVLMSSATFVL